MCRVLKLEIAVMMVGAIMCGHLDAAVVNVNEGSTSGYTMTDGNTYVIQDSVSFTNSVAGGSGMSVEEGATVVLYVPSDFTLTTAGADGNAQTGGGAGILVPSNSVLVVTGEGVINAIGGSAGKGGDGQNGENGTSSFESGTSGEGGAGGMGGGGAGAAIGGAGGRGGISGVGAGCSSELTTKEGKDGGAGGNGETSDAMGAVYILGRMEIQAKGGGNATNGVAGVTGERKKYSKVSPWYGFAGGGGGGGGGGAGAAPKSPIGAGGQSGGGGGGGGSGGIATDYAHYYNNYKPDANPAGGGGSGGLSAVASGETGGSKEEKGGTGGSGGMAGALGDEGILYVSSTAIVNVDRNKLSAETHLSAQYSLIFDANGGSLSPDTASVVATLGCALPDCIPAPSWKGHLFCGWKDDNGTKYYDSDGVSLLSSYPVPKDLVLYAEWVDDPKALVITPISGTTFEDTLTIAMESSVDNATIYFTLDGSEPSVDSPVYERKFRIKQKTTIKAIAMCDDWTNSSVVVANYALGKCPNPKITSDVGETLTHGSALVSISWECEDGILRYTTDGSDVTDTSPEYTESLSLDDTTTVKAKAFGETYFDSEQTELTITKKLESVSTPLIHAADTFSGRKAVVSISCANEGAEIYYTLNGNEPNEFSTHYTGPFEICESTIVKAYAILSDYADSEVTTKTISKVWGIGDSVGLPDHTFTTDGAAGWIDENGAAMRSGKISNTQVSILQATFIGKGHLSFELKTSCEEDDPQYVEYDHAEIWIDGVLQAKLDGIHDWIVYEYDLDSDTHTVEWKYVKDELDEDNYIGEDCIWVRNVIWEPELTCTTQVPVKLDWIRNKFGDLGNYYFDYEEKANGTASNGHKVWECYVAGEEPTDSNSIFQAHIDMVNGSPVVRWAPDLNSNSIERVYTVWGKTNLTDKAWHSPTNDSSHFFKVTVEMP